MLDLRRKTDLASRGKEKKTAPMVRIFYLESARLLFNFLSFYLWTSLSFCYGLGKFIFDLIRRT